MDLLDRINALTDDQLQMVAERDDASGVLAAYRLAELRGLPYPDREAAILGDGYVIVAQNGEVKKVPVASVEKIIREESGEYCVYSEDGSRSFGCYPTMSEAQERLRQIHSFKAATVIDVDGTVINYGRVNRELVQAVNAMPGPKVILTARSETMREETVRQLEDAGIRYSRLILKPETDQATSSWKADQVRSLAGEYGKITAIDDEADNRAAMRAAGAEVLSPSQVTQPMGKAVLREGSFVSWNSSGGRARGQIEHVMYEGVLGIPESDFKINAEPDDPAVLIRIWREYADGWRGTETLVGHKMSTLTSIEPLSKATKREDGQDFPPEAFAYVPEPDRPSTWKLRLWDSLEEKVTAAQVGRALAALGPGGFRGNRVQIPAADLPAVRRRILAAWRTVHEPDAEVPEVLKQESFVPPKGVQEAAQRALEWIAEGHAGSGFTDVGRARAAQLARGDAVSETTIRRMRSFLARHGVNREKPGWNAGDEDFPSGGRVAWDAWGGDAAVSWTESIVGRLDSEEKQYDPEIALNPRQQMMYEKYEWIAETLGPWDGGIGGDGAHYIPATDNVFADKGMKCANCVFFEGGGGCEILDMAVEPEAVCKLWIIPEDRVKESLKSLSKDSSFLRKQAARKFTLGPLYVPDFMDAHGEWTDSEELQQAVWGWVQSGDRTIYLQHDTKVRAGEWVEVMTMPQPWTVDMLDGKGNSIGKITYPAGTVFLGVIWDDGPWQQIVRGELRGYSIGGFSDRVLADLPEEAARDGVEMDA